MIVRDGGENVTNAQMHPSFSKAAPTPSMAAPTPSMV